MQTVQIDEIRFVRNEDEDSDGHVLYLILQPCTERPCTHVCETHPQMDHSYARQRFRRGQNGHTRNATQEDIAKHWANVWGWDGDDDEPTLSPSFLVNTTELGPLGYKLHCFIKKGAIDLCGDSSVVLHSNPVECRLRA